MAIEDDARKLRNLAAESLEFARTSRRSLLATAGTALGAAALAGLPQFAAADEVPAAGAGGKKVRVGVPLTYGPFNQPWRRGCWQLVKTVLDSGGEVVTVRGQPTKQSEQEAERALLDRGIDVLCLGIYSLESETAYIADEAHKRGIKTVGFAVTVKEFASGHGRHLGDRDDAGLFSAELPRPAGHHRADRRGARLLHALRHGG